MILNELICAVSILNSAWRIGIRYRSGECTRVSTKLPRRSRNVRERGRALGHDILWSDRRVLVGFSCSGIPPEFAACLICDDFSRVCHFFPCVAVVSSLKALHTSLEISSSFFLATVSLLNFNARRQEEGEGRGKRRKWSSDFFGNLGLY